MTGLAEGTLILAFVTPRRYRRGDEADLPVRSRWWVLVWTVFGRSLGAGFLVFLVFFALALIGGGRRHGHGRCQAVGVYRPHVPTPTPLSGPVVSTTSTPGDAGDPAPAPIEPTSGHMRCGDKVIDVGVGKRSGAAVWISPREIRDFLLGGRRASLVR